MKPRGVEAGLLASVVVLGVTGVVVAPTACAGLFVRVLAAVAGIGLLAWLWGWRRPRLRRRVGRLARAVRAAAETHVPVLSVYWLGSASSLGHLFLRVVVATDHDRAILQGETFAEQFRQQLTACRLPFPGQQGISLIVDSQETVDRDFAGRWHAYDK